MCIICRSRQAQDSLFRLKLEGREVVAYDGKGRSFYLCEDCSKNEKKIRGLVKRFGIEEERLRKLLEELSDNG